MLLHEMDESSIGKGSLEVAHFLRKIADIERIRQGYEQEECISFKKDQFSSVIVQAESFLWTLSG